MSSNDPQAVLQADCNREWEKLNYGNPSGHYPSIPAQRTARYKADVEFIRKWGPITHKGWLNNVTGWMGPHSKAGIVSARISIYEQSPEYDNDQAARGEKRNLPEPPKEIKPLLEKAHDTLTAWDMKKIRPWAIGLPCKNSAAKIMMLSEYAPHWTGTKIAEALEVSEKHVSKTLGGKKR